MVLDRKRKKPTKTNCVIRSPVEMSEDSQLTTEWLRTTSTCNRSTPRTRRVVALLMILAVLAWQPLVDNLAETASNFGITIFSPSTQDGLRKNSRIAAINPIFRGILVGAVALDCNDHANLCHYDCLVDGIRNPTEEMDTVCTCEEGYEEDYAEAGCEGTSCAQYYKCNLC